MMMAAEECGSVCGAREKVSTSQPDGQKMDVSKTKRDDINGIK